MRPFSDANIVIFLKDTILYPEKVTFFLTTKPGRRARALVFGYIFCSLACCRCGQAGLGGDTILIHGGAQRNPCSDNSINLQILQ